MERTAEICFAGSEAATRPYWDGLQSQVLRLQRCNDCGERYFHPRPFCPFCSSSHVEWMDCSGQGTIYSYTVDYRHKDAPKVFGYVTLAEGPTIMARIQLDKSDRIAIGASARADFDTLPDGTPGIFFRA